MLVYGCIHPDKQKPFFHFQKPLGRENDNNKKSHLTTSPVVQWLQTVLPMQGVWVQPLVKELRSHMWCKAAKNKLKEKTPI